MELCYLLSKINNDRQLKIKVYENDSVKNQVLEGTCNSLENELDELLSCNVLEVFAENNTLVIYATR